MESIFSPDELEARLGESLKELRLQKNLDRQTLCEQAGISMNALRHLETGQGSTIKTLIRIVRALDRQDWLLGIAPKVSVNPLHMVRDHSFRQRASRRSRAYGKKEKD
jgi:transcriptional regulator with XRE-family HTH domain